MYKKPNIQTSRNRQKCYRLPITAAIYLALSSVAFADTQTPAAATTAQPATPEDKKVVLDTIQVTAQKRKQNLQDVPISIISLSDEKLEEFNVNSMEDYAKLLPTMTYQEDGGIQGGGKTPYFRGVSSGNDGNHSGASPSVGVYLDEQPVTTIGGALPIHIYDIERIEALAGPQGTLYGASSQSGTLKIVTNKPDASDFAAGYSVEVNSVTSGTVGNIEEGFVNLPLSENTAIRLVGWNEHDAGYIDNVYGERTFPTSGITINNADTAQNNYNTASNFGARLALKVDLNDEWSILPSIMTQTNRTNGSFGYDQVVGDLEITHFYPESSDDNYTQAALTVTGKIGNFDVTYAYANLSREINAESDYNDYGFWYDTVKDYGDYFYDNNSNLINPSQYIQAVYKHKIQSNELRIASPLDQSFHFILGYFSQTQSQDIQERYKIDDLADSLEVPGWSDTIWLTKQTRRDDSQAIFGEATYDFTSKLSATAGFRYFRQDNSLQGFFGFGAGYASGADYGEAACIAAGNTTPYNGAPCSFFNKEIKESGTLGKFNMTYNLADGKLIYGTWSEGYRPGGINRRGTLPPYLSDYLTNYEAGWKTTWLENRLSFNGAIFRQYWKDFQFATLGLNGLTEIKNANQARVDGLEMEANWAATYNLTVGGGVAFYDSVLTENYCGQTINGQPLTDCPIGSTILTDSGLVSFPDGPPAPTGTQLPVTPKFKGSINARYTFDWAGLEPFIQGALVYEGERKSDLRVVENAIKGDMPAYTVFDLSAGIHKNDWTLNLYVKNLFNARPEFRRYTLCPVLVCGAAGYDTQYPNGQVYTVVSTPRTIGMRFSQEF